VRDQGTEHRDGQRLVVYMAAPGAKDESTYDSGLPDPDSRVPFRGNAGMA
jgi:hypothetical protein